MELINMLLRDIWSITPNDEYVFISDSITGTRLYTGTFVDVEWEKLNNLIVTELRAFDECLYIGVQGYGL